MTAAHQNQHDDIAVVNEKSTSSPQPASNNINKKKSGSTAIILNLNARSVISNSDQLISMATNIVGSEHVYVTRTVDDALLAARAVVRKLQSSVEKEEQQQQQQPYSLVVPIGGDGTLSACLDSMVNEVLLLDKLSNRSNSSNNSSKNSSGGGGSSGSSGNNMMKVHEAIDKLPCIGYIPMGTGNGLGYVIGCRMPRRRRKKKKSNINNNNGDNDNDEDDDDDSRDDGKKKKKKKWSEKLLSKISIKRRKVEHAGRVMKRLKQIGDELQQQQQQQRLSGQAKGETGGGGGGGKHLKYSIVEMPMMEVTHHSPTDDDEEQEQQQQQQTKKGDLCFFAGSGFDSLMLEDFKQVKAWSKSPKRKLPSFIKDMLSSVAGYSVALVTRTLPQTLMHQTHKIHVKVTTTDEDTLWVDHRRGDFSELAIGRSGNSSGAKRGNNERDDDDGNEGGSTTTTTTKRKKKKHLIYSGTTGILAASTTPYYGGGLRLFPYARLIPMKLQLRIGRISPLTGFLRIPSIFEGSYRDKSDDEFGCLDFIADEFEVEVSGTRYEEYLKRKNEYEEEKKSNSNKRGWWRWKRWTKRGDDDDASSGDETTPTTITPTHTNSSVPESSSSQKGFPFQHSGESMGIKEMFRVRVIKKPVKFISFKTPRIVVDD